MAATSCHLVPRATAGHHGHSGVRAHQHAVGFTTTKTTTTTTIVVDVLTSSSCRHHLHHHCHRHHHRHRGSSTNPHPRSMFSRSRYHVRHTVTADPTSFPLLSSVGERWPDVSPTRLSADPLSPLSPPQNGSTPDASPRRPGVPGGSSRVARHHQHQHQHQQHHQQHDPGLTVSLDARSTHAAFVPLFAAPSLPLAWNLSDSILDTWP